MVGSLRSTAWGSGWFAASTLGLAFALAATECERYTALWNFGTRSLPELLSIVVFLIVAVWLLARESSSQGQPLYARTALVWTLAALQFVAMVARICELAPSEGPLYILTSLGIQCSSITLLLYAQYNLATGVRKSVTSLAMAFIVSGLIQMATVALPRPVSLCTVALLPVGAAALLTAATRMRGDKDLAAEREDIGIETSRMAKPRGKGSASLAAFCASLFLLDVLLIALHSQAMALQDGSITSSTMQAFSGLGAIISGAVFLLAMRKLHEFELLEALRLLVLPLVVVALYLAMSSGGTGVGLNMVLLSSCYALLILFIWTVPRQMSQEQDAFRNTCMGYISYRMGWAVGILGIMVVPSLVDGASHQPVIIAALGALILLSGVQILSFVRGMTTTPDAAPANTPVVLDAHETFLMGCHLVAEKYGLSPREEEVLAFLARGRNARYVANALMIAEGTARGHITHIYQKLGVRSQQALMDIVDSEVGRLEN